MCAAPDFDSGLVDMSGGIVSFLEIKHGLGVVPERTQVLIKPKFGTMSGKACVRRENGAGVSAIQPLALHRRLLL